MSDPHYHHPRTAMIAIPLRAIYLMLSHTHSHIHRETHTDRQTDTHTVTNCIFLFWFAYIHVSADTFTMLGMFMALYETIPIVSRRLPRTFWSRMGSKGSFHNLVLMAYELLQNRDMWVFARVLGWYHDLICRFCGLIRRHFVLFNNTWKWWSITVAWHMASFPKLRGLLNFLKPF